MLGTLLHELVHNSISRHGRIFQRKLEEITVACELLIGDMFRITHLPDCGGLVLGGDKGVLAAYSQRELARFAAETRIAQRASMTTALEIVDLETTTSDPAGSCGDVIELD